MAGFPYGTYLQNEETQERHKNSSGKNILFGGLNYSNDPNEDPTGERKQLLKEVMLARAGNRGGDVLNTQLNKRSWAEHFLENKYREIEDNGPKVAVDTVAAEKLRRATVRRAKKKYEPGAEGYHQAMYDFQSRLGTDGYLPPNPPKQPDPERVAEQEQEFRNMKSEAKRVTKANKEVEKYNRKVKYMNRATVKAATQGTRAIVRKRKAAMRARVAEKNA
jgi:hypothetical protein